MRLSGCTLRIRKEKGRETKIHFIRGNEHLSFSKPKTYFGLGQIGTGKSTLLESVAIEHMKRGAVVVDAYGSADGENLAWLRSDLIKDKRVLLLRGESVDVVTQHDVKMVENITLKDLERYDLIVSSRPCFLNRDFEFYSLGKLVSLLYKRLHWKRLLCLVAREASSLWYSRIRVSDSQSDAKNESLYMLREMRHLGVSLALDSLRLLGIDVDLRSHVDYLFLKAMGLNGLDDSLKWLYHFFDPRFIRGMKPWEFILCCRSGSLGLGHFEDVPFHKREKEDITKICGLKISYGKEIEKPKDMGSFETVGDKQHIEIIRLYAEEGKGFNLIAEELGRSSRTPYTHVHKHNDAVNRSGFCAICRRAGGQYSGEVVKRGINPKE
jgi:hypothetical protein